LVEVETDKNGQSHYKQAFNTQACEQLNAWLGGFETILKRMSAGNFNWFLHTMLFIHTERVMEKMRKKIKKNKVYESDVEDN
jgi:predicted GNAT superfamily acetyltransferase